MKKIIIFLVLIFIGASGFFILNKHSKYYFEGEDISGKISLESYNGEYKVIYFGYTLCPDVCPAALGILAGVLNKIKNNNITVLFISLDPQRDTPQITDEYVKYFYPNSHGLVVKDLEKVAKHYGVKFKKVKLDKSAMDYSIAHSSSLYLIDKNGKFISEISNLTDANIQKQIEEMLKQ